MDGTVLAKKIKEFYEIDGNSTGGLLHIVLDDGNIKTHFIEWCIKQAKKANDFKAVELGELLLKASMTQRRKLVKDLYTVIL